MVNIVPGDTPEEIMDRRERQTLQEEAKRAAEAAAYGAAHPDAEIAESDAGIIKPPRATLVVILVLAIVAALTYFSIK